MSFSSSQPPDNSVSPEMRQHLAAVRSNLLKLHKSILEVEREFYERANGRIESPHALLQLVMHDPWFGWFRPLSEIVVRMDELLDAPSAPAGSPAADLHDDSDAVAILRELRSLLVPAEQGEEFAVKYHAILQVAPETILAHAQLTQLLDSR